MKMDGRADALADIKAAHPRLLLYGREAGDLDERKRLFRERMAIEVDPLAGCIVSASLVKYADDYNREIEDFITRRFALLLFDQPLIDLSRSVSNLVLQNQTRAEGAINDVRQQPSHDP